MTAYTIKMTVCGAVVLAVALAAGNAWAKGNKGLRRGPATAKAVKAAVAPATSTRGTTAAEDSEVCEDKGWKEFIANYQPEGRNGTALRGAPVRPAPVAYAPATAEPAAAKKAKLRRPAQ